MSEIAVGFIDKFDFIDDSSSEKLSGHPKVGRVYQILKLDGVYFLHIGHANTKAKLDGITLGPGLSGNYMDKWSYKVDLLTKDNYIDYPLSVEDMEKVSLWLESDHKELRGLLNKPMSPVVIADIDNNGNFDPINDQEAEKLNQAIARTLSNHLPITKQLVESIAKSVNVLMFHNPELLDAVSELLSVLAELSIIEDSKNIREHPVEDFLLFSKSKDTAIYNAIDSLYAYSNDGSPQKDHLYRALHFGLLELQRRKLQDE
ncbi:MAG: hypothetical protein KGQ83_01570 [Planctomycetes bacterium]|nr:hypothetical protein [Planctomycetota bacterium]